MVERYINWGDEHEVLVASQYVRVADFTRALHNVRRIPFSVKASRDEARNRLIDLPTQHVSAESRFPDGVYVDVSTGMLAEALDRLLSALDHGERSLDREPGTASKYSELGDSKVAFTKGLQSILQILARSPVDTLGEGVFTRATFESYYRLQWGAPPPRQN